MKFIQFIGTQRSGSNLLRIMLNQLPEITAPHPPHILKTFNPLLPHYGDLNNPPNFESLVNDVCSWVELNPVSWHLTKINRAEIGNRCKEKSLMQLNYEIYSYYAELHLSDYTCCKSMSNVHVYEDLESAGLFPYYIYLHRDGRDVACSFKKAIVGEKHVYHIAKQWKADQEKALEVKQKIPSNRFIEVNYKDLITNPKLLLMEVCSFLKVPFRNEMLDYFHAEESLNTSCSGAMWKNVSQPIMVGNYNKYISDLTLEEIEIFERVAGEVLQKLNYPLTSDYESIPDIGEKEIEDYSVQNCQMKKKAILMADKHDLELRCPQKQLLIRLKKRLVVNKKDMKEKYIGEGLHPLYA